MKRISLFIDSNDYDGILNHTKFVKTFIRQAIHEKLKSYTTGMKNFNELSQQSDYHSTFQGDGIRLKGADINKKNGCAEILGDKRQLELINHQPVKKVDPNKTYVVIGEDNKLNNVLIKPIKK